MKPVLLWTPQAREDLLDIYITIGLESLAAAERVCTALEQKVNVLESFPRMGMRRPEIAPVARMLVEGMYLVLYKTHPDTDDGPVETVEIVRIIHGHRNLEHIF